MSDKSIHRCLDTCEFQKLGSADKQKILNIVDQNDSQLIGALEVEMQISLVDIDFSKNVEESIGTEDLYKWYIASEKVLRVIGNLFASPMHQAVNQLRYAGHHILKANLARIAKDDVAEQAELIEAFKHCKRSTYDALDAYIYQTNRIYQNVLPYLVDSEATKLERNLRDHLASIARARNSVDSRIEYYEYINQKLIEGLSITEKLNQIQRDSGLSEDILTEKKQLVSQINDLRGVVSALDIGRKEALFELEKKTKVKATMIAWASYWAPIAALFYAVHLQSTIPSTHKVEMNAPTTQEAK